MRTGVRHIGTPPAGPCPLPPPRFGGQPGRPGGRWAGWPGGCGCGGATGRSAGWPVCLLWFVGLFVRAGGRLSVGLAGSPALGRVWSRWPGNPGGRMGWAIGNAPRRWGRGSAVEWLGGRACDRVGGHLTVGWDPRPPVIGLGEVRKGLGGNGVWAIGQPGRAHGRCVGGRPGLGGVWTATKTDGPWLANQN